MKILFISLFFGVLLTSGCYILYNRYDNGYIDQHTMWWEGKEYLYTYVMYKDSIYDFQKVPIEMVTEGVRDKMYKEGEEKLKFIKSK